MIIRSGQDNTRYPLPTNQGYVILLIMLFFKTIKSRKISERFYCDKIQLVDKQNHSILSNQIVSSVSDICISKYILSHFQLEILEVKKIIFENYNIIEDLKLFEDSARIPFLVYFKGVTFVTKFMKKTYLT